MGNRVWCRFGCGVYFRDWFASQEGWTVTPRMKLAFNGQAGYEVMPGFSGPAIVQFSHSVVSDSLWPHGLQHARLPCPSPTPEACSNSCPSNRWCHPIISSSVIPFSSCLQSFPGSFPMSQFFSSGGQSIGISASASVLPVNIQDWSPLGWTGWIFLQSKGLKSLLQHHSSKASILQCSAFFMVQLSHPYLTTGKIIALTRWTSVGKVMSLLVNMLTSILKVGHSFSSKKQASFNFMAAYPGLWWFYTIAGIYTCPNALNCTH